MNDTSNLRLEIAEVGEQVLGSNLIGLQLGNEPDLYAGYVLSRRFKWPRITFMLDMSIDHQIILLRITLTSSV